MKSSKLALLLAVMIIGGILTPVVSAASSIILLSPNGGEKWTRGTTRTITWTESGINCSNVKIELLKPGMLNKVINYSTADDGSYGWKIPLTQTLGNDYKIRITCTTNSAYTDTSNNYFTISAPITVISPNGGEKWTRGTTKTITWTSSGNPGAYVKIELLRPGMLNKVINYSTENDGSYSWPIPLTQTLGNNYKIRVTSTTNSASTDTSNNNFTISAPITVISPNGGEKWTRGTTRTITWTESGINCSNVKIELLKPGMLNKVINYSTDDDGSYGWKIPSTQTLGNDYKIRVTCTTNSAYTDTSNNNFTIRSAITVVSPNGGEQYLLGQSIPIKWTYFDNAGTNVKIELLKTGVLKKVINSSTPNDGLYSWPIPSTYTLGNDYKIRVTSTANSAYTDTSNNNFIISTIY